MNTRAAPDILAAARSPSGENNIQLFSDTLRSLRYPIGNTLGLWFFIGLCGIPVGVPVFIQGCLELPPGAVSAMDTPSLRDELSPEESTGLFTARIPT